MLKRILVLDDNQDILEVVHETLSYEKFEVRSTCESKDVLPFVEEFNPDLVLLSKKNAAAAGVYDQAQFVQG